MDEWMNGWRDRHDEGRLHFPHSRRPYGRNSWIGNERIDAFRRYRESSCNQGDNNA